ncbi:MAG TPA: hypothetical protein DCQ50_21035 [Chryseobacterium sp.]|nr:hypothetical protein [Chryseobacterium sp.]
MKTIRISLLLLVMAVYSSCQKKHKQQPLSVQVTSLVDITDPRAVMPDAETILSCFDFTNDKDKEAFFRLTTTTDKLLNPVSENHLASGYETEKDNQFDDPDYRKKLVLSFYSGIRECVNKFNTKSQHDSILRYSECFRSIASELVRMKENKADKSLLLVYSDLCENSDLFSVYKKTATEQLLKHPDSVLQKFESTGLLPEDLSHFTVTIIFQPRSRDQDRLFNAMAELYKRMLSNRRAKVIIGSDNPKYL